MRTQEQYLEKLAGMKHNLYINGECVGRDDPRVIRASIEGQKRERPHADRRRQV